MFLKQFIFSFVLLAAICAVNSSSHSCGDWEPYLDEKCFKVFNNLPLQNFNDAQTTCGAQEGPAKLLSIGSLEEEAFLQKLLFTSTKVVDAVWLGARNVGGKYLWTDGANLSYANWAPGSPTNRADYCVQMDPEVGNKGKWTDEPCSKKNLVACQKPTTLSLAEMKEILFQVRKEQQTTNAQLKAQEALITALQGKVGGNTVPLGFIYVQLPKEKAPSEIWPSMKWTEVSSTYAGVFFRVAGGGAGQFGTIQNENSPKLSQVETKDCQSVPTDECGSLKQASPQFIPGNGTWSDWVTSADHYVNEIAGSDVDKRILYNDYLRFRLTTGEVRPKNMAVKVWKRTA